MTVGRNLKKNAVVVLESTVYPGVTEEIVVDANNMRVNELPPIGGTRSRKVVPEELVEE